MVLAKIPWKYCLAGRRGWLENGDVLQKIIKIKKENFFHLTHIILCWNERNTSAPTDSDEIIHIRLGSPQLDIAAPVLTLIHPQTQKAAENVNRDETNAIERRIRIMSLQ